LVTRTMEKGADIVMMLTWSGDTNDLGSGGGREEKPDYGTREKGPCSIVIKRGGR